MTGKTLQGTIDAACAHLEATAKDLRKQLSFDLGSVGALEEILIALTDIGADQAALKGATFLVGAYLGEILRREMGGEWSATPDGEFAMQVGDANIFPIARVRKFIADPAANGLVFFAEAFVAKRGVVRP